MNPETIKLLVWAAMHHSSKVEFKFPSLTIFSYVSGDRIELSLTVKRPWVYVPAIICLDYVKLYGATTPELQRWHNITKLREQP